MPEKISWNEDQSKAITTTDKGVVVSAAAGSGKTAVLIERTIRLLSDPVNKLPADKLLAVTFTVDAASQLREKLAQAFEKAIRGSRDSETKKWLRSQQERLPLARISTINSFCLDIVRSNLNEFEFEEGVRIIDENDAETVLTEAFDEALDKLAEQSPEDFRLLYERIGGGVERVKSCARQLYTFLRSLAFPEEWFENTVARMRSDASIPEWVNTAAFVYQGYLERAMKSNEEAMHLISKLPRTDKEVTSNIAVLNEDLSLMTGMKYTLEDGGWEEILSRAGAKFSSFKKRPSKKSTLSPEDAELFALIGDIRDDSKKQFQKILKEAEKLGSNLKAPMQLSADVLEALHRYCLTAQELAYKEKLRRNALEFSDVEIMALGLLVKSENGRVERTPLCEELVSGGQYSIILIDEFQDVNNIQELIFKALSKTEDISMLGLNTFVVGDVKQSIYRFRLSNPTLFIKAKEKAADSASAEASTLVELKSNYRSRGSVIDFVNLIFSQIMSEQIGEVAYTGGERLEKGADYYIGDDLPAELIFVDNVEEEESGETVSPDENEAIASRIRQLIDEGAEVFDKDMGKLRPCRPGDFCVLYRSGGSVDTLAACLEKYGLKTSTEKNKGYLRSREISLAVSILKVIDNPMRDIPLAAIMLSPVMGFTADELARLRLLCKTDKGTDHLYQVISSIAQTDEQAHEKESRRLEVNDPALESKCRSAKELISRLGFYSAGMSLSALIRRIYDETELVAAASTFENSRQKRANLRLLLEYAASYEENADSSVAGFVRYLNSLTVSGRDLIQAAVTVEDSDSVLVKTIHSSKGLEYPFVFLCGTSKKFRTDDLSAPLLLDEYAGAGLILRDRDKLTKTETVAHAALRAIAKDKLMSEEMRLLYVALTRAKERIFIPIVLDRDKDGVSRTETLARRIGAQLSQSGGVNPRIVRDCNNYLGWLLAALLCSSIGRELADRLGVDQILPTVPYKAEVVCRDFVPESRSSAKPEFYQGKADSAALTDILSSFIFTDTHPFGSAAAKLSVTEIVTAEKQKQLGDKNPDFYPQLPRLSDEVGKLSAAKKGTCTHLFMELADYPSAEADAKAELDRLTQRGFFTEKEAKGVYLDAVRSFFSGDFYKRIKASPNVMREKKFLVAADELGLPDSYREHLESGSMLQGVADCIFEEGAGYILVDYKTDNVSDVSELYTYKTQLELYKAALNLILDKPVTACYIYSFKLRQGVEIHL
ncbi:MAG: UvrD-helicase domain-containing protein [Ruminococcus sp.]|nr:UvrD-helicase domain-containing protein [Ruminococcus sp.]